ncbi:uncharacterized protein LOC123691877 [Colias croceus]|uniref:uncharacterized protein LOC123691877 n=1 Tax=Colias crocea TaxID=72248 RepID=UPI001E2807FC|nr:uncharacterized protein LOC123691877 [Colias croceus]
METRLSKRKRIGSLPGGDRRGTPGADAGCFSMRTVSGEELSRRASTDKNTTAEHYDENDAPTDRANTPEEPYSPSTISYTPSASSSPSTTCLNPCSPTPTLDVAREANAFLPASTKAGKPRVRMRWSKDVNIFIMRTYYYITKLETDFTIYRKQLHELFTQEYPEINVSEQRISDQRRTIVRNKLLDQETLNRLKEEVQVKLQTEIQNTETNELIAPIYTPTDNMILSTYSLSQSPTQSSHIFTQTESTTLTLENDTVIRTDNNNMTENELVQDLYDKFREVQTQYSEIDPTVRPKLPKLRYSPQLDQLVKIFNSQILGQFINDELQLKDIHTIIYCTALVISEKLNYKIINNRQDAKSKNYRKPPWEIRLEKDIEKLRADCGRLTQYINNNRSKKLVKKVEAIFKTRLTHTRHENNNKKPEEFLDTLKQKLALKVHRLKRYKKAQQRKNDNKMFATNEKQFYRNLQKPKTGIHREDNQNIPTVQQLEDFWAGIWEQQVEHNDKADWISEETEKWSSIEEMEFVEITEADIRNITARLHNWKSPGVDRIHNYWYKKLIVLHKSLAKNLSDIIKGHQNIPEFITTGITYMLPKTDYSPLPSQYRPITCLPTIYKILTSAITVKINSHIERYNIIAEEQKGCRRGHMGCKEQLIIDSTIHKHATTKNRNLHCTYIDYKKAFDSIPHTWLIQILKMYKVNSKLVDFLQNIMTQWKTTLHLSTHHINISTREIFIRKGIYQGDSLSPMWFCLALNPLSHLLQNSKAGYYFKRNVEETVISHLIYMDDIKLYAKSDRDMKKLVDITARFSKDIKMEFGLDKCKTLHIIKGKVRPGDYEIENGETIAAIEPTDLYKYLGYKQLKGLDHSTIKKTLITEYKKRLSLLCKTQLSGKALIKSINTYAIPILTYSFGIIKWSKTNIETIERNTRTILTKYNNLHPKSAIERLTIKREHGGRGLIDIRHLWKKQISKLKIFFQSKSRTSSIHQTILQHDHKYTPLNLIENTDIPNIDADPTKRKIEDWRKKVLHGRHPHDLAQPHIDTIASNKWLKIGNLFPETEGFMIAIQDQIINTRNYRKYIIKDPTIANDKCRKCNIQSETIQHITGACTTLTQTDYTHRHNQNSQESI